MLLTPLADNGGPTLTMLPEYNSPLVDSGPSSADVGAVDQRGKPRLINLRADIGAVEFDPICFARTNSSATIYTTETSLAVRQALSAVSAGGTVKISGVCAGTQLTSGLPQVAYINKNVDLQGGWDSRFTVNNPTAYPTVLDAAGNGRVLFLTNGATVNASDLTLKGGSIASLPNVYYDRIRGGGIYIDENVTVDLLRSQIVGNTAEQQGGGIYIRYGATLSLTQSSVLSNTVGKDGGGIYSLGTLTVTGSTLAGNVALEKGGGILADQYPSVAIQNSSVYNNEAASGAGLWSNSQRGVSIVNTTISSNRASTSGGGLYLAWAGGDLRFVTIANNSAPQGAGIYNSSATSRLLASIVTVTPDQTNCAGSKPLLSNGGYNRISDLSCNLQNTTADDLQNVGNVQLEPLSDNGGPTLSHKPVADPSTVDVMPGFVCEANFADADMEDQRRRVRPSLGIRQEGVVVPEAEWRCDIGAVELGEERQRVCGAPLLLGYVGDTPQFSDPLRCDVTTIAEAIDRAQTGDTVVVTGIITESVVVNKSVTIRGPLIEEITPGTHMGVVQGQKLAPTSNGTTNGGIFQIEAGREVTIEQLNLRHGRAARGGAIDNAGNLTLNGVTIYSSRAASGSAVYNVGDLQIRNSTILSNTASSGVIQNSPSGAVDVRHATIVGNSGVILHNERNDGFTVASSILKRADSKFMHRRHRRWPGQPYPQQYLPDRRHQRRSLAGCVARQRRSYPDGGHRQRQPSYGQCKLCRNSGSTGTCAPRRCYLRCRRIRVRAHDLDRLCQLCGRSDGRALHRPADGARQGHGQ
ncbi:MAG: right-handed parallel beta-helix repeat-containing protein [Caldilineaceae bacterium]